MEVRFIYRNRSDDRFYDASKPEMRGGPDKVIVYLDGVLCAMDREAKVFMPVSRWRLAQIGLACLMAAAQSASNICSCRPGWPMAYSQKTHALRGSE